MAYQIAPERRLAYRLIVFLVAVASALGFGLMAATNPRNGAEMQAEDALARLAPRPARPDIVLVAADEASVGQYGPVKSWPRSLLADGLRRVEAGKPKVVVLDLPLATRTRTGDESLWRVMANNRNVVLGMAYNADRTPPFTADDVRALRYLQKFAFTSALTFGTQTQVFPWTDFEPPVSDFTGSSRGVGVFDRETDPDGIVRDARLFYVSVVQEPNPLPPLPGKFPPSPLADGASVALPNLALVAGQRVFDLDKDYVVIRADRTVHLAGNLNPPVDVPVDEQGRMQIRYAGPSGHALAYSFQDVAAGKVGPETFRDKVVLMGVTAAGDPASDMRPTPFGEMPRVEITANALQTLMDRTDYELVTAHRRHTLGVMFLIGLAVGLTLMLFSRGQVLLAALLLAVGDLALCYGCLVAGHAMLPLLPGLLTILVTLAVALALSLGPFRPVYVPVSPTYVPPPSDVVH